MRRSEGFAGCAAQPARAVTVILAVSLLTFTSAVAVSASSPLGQPDPPPQAAPKPSKPAPTQRHSAPTPTPRRSTVTTHATPRVSTPRPRIATPKPTTAAKPRVGTPTPRPAVTKRTPAPTSTPAVTTPAVVPKATPRATVSTSRSRFGDDARQAMKVGGLLLLAALAAMVAAIPFAVDRVSFERRGVLRSLSRFWPESTALSAATGILAVLVWLQG